MADLKSLMPHLRRIAISNGIMILYFLSPSFLSFVAILIVLMAVIFDNPTESLKTILNCSEGSEQFCTINSVNQSYENFKKLTILQKIFLLVGLKLAIDFTWLLPNWLLVFIGTQIFADWTLLKQFGLIEMGKNYVQLANKSIEKVTHMIPKYQAK